jgi:hypothetical protein
MSGKSRSHLIANSTVTPPLTAVADGTCLNP